MTELLVIIKEREIFFKIQSSLKNEIGVAVCRTNSIEEQDLQKTAGFDESGNATLSI